MTITLTTSPTSARAHMLRRAARDSVTLYPGEIATITIRHRSWLSGLLPSITYLREWAEVLK